MSKADGSPAKAETPSLPDPSEMPSVTVNRGLLGIPEALAFWRRKNPASS